MTSPTTWEFAAHPELKRIREKLLARYGASLKVLPSSPEFFTFQVCGKTDEALIRELEREQTELSGSQGLFFQTSCKLGRNDGVSICYLPGGPLTDDPGFWYY